MPDFITLACPSCGARLEITNDLDRFACSHCGQEHIVQRKGGIISLSPVIGAINQVQKGVDRTAAELALQRLPKEIDVLQAERNKITFENTNPYKAVVWPWISLVCGAIFLIIGLLIIFISIITPGNIQSNKFVLDCFFGSSFLVLGFLGAAYGAFEIFYLIPRKKQYWEQEIQPRLKSLDEQISKRQFQIKYNQNLLSN
jgi:DNA-directed RNA polymerase subunit RPC12/RpoP